MNVIFLDIDGVINHPGIYADNATWRDNGDGLLRIPVAHECVTRLNRLVAETEAKIVISSSWRLVARWQDLGQALERHGFVGDVVGETPDLINDHGWLRKWRERHGEEFTFERLERGWEIAEYIRRHQNVYKFVILDDCSDMADLRPMLVHVDATTGLDDPDVERAKWLLTQHDIQYDVLDKINTLV